MDSKAVICNLRHKFSSNGWILLIYYGIMNVSVLIAVALEALIYRLQLLLNSTTEQAEFIQVILNRSLENGGGYLLACLIGGVILLLWKKSDYCFRQLWKREKRMSLSIFSVLFCVFLSGQAIQLFLMPMIEKLLNLFGLTAATLVESTTAGSTTVGMFLYVAIFAPVFEEILFRGLILRNLLPYGKKFAILTSSFLFGIFHGNVIQTPFAFMVGLVLGYAAAEYGLIWSVFLHMLNNLVLGELTALFTKLFPSAHVNLAVYALIFGCAIFALVLAATKWNKIADYFSKNRVDPLYLKCFFSAKGVMVFTAVMLLNMLSYLFV